MRHLVAFALLTIVPATCLAQNLADDEYTRYELLSPESSSFRITYDVTAVTPGANSVPSLNVCTFFAST